METGDHIELDIEKVVYPGKGLARVDGYVLFVKGVLSGEKVRACITKIKKNYAEADLEEVLEPSPLRTEPGCELDFKCPGCCYQHTDYENEVNIKLGQLMSFLGHEAGMEPPAEIHLVRSPDCVGYRNKITMRVSEDDGGSSLGYIGYDKKSVVDVPSCPLAMPEINEFLVSLRDDKHFKSSASDGSKVVLRHSAEPGVYYSIKARRRKSYARLSVSMQYAEEETVIGTFKVPPSGFFQVNRSVMNLMLEYVMDTLQTVKPASFIDLYCGSGPFTVAASIAGVPDVLGVDVDSFSIRAAKLNCSDRAIKNVTFVSGPAGDCLEDALSCIDNDKAMILVDPTRRGLEQSVRNTLISKMPRHIMYVSCAPDTLARDLKPLSTAGYKIEKAGLFDMFPRTSHFESVTLLSR